MKKLITILVLGLLFSSSVFAISKKDAAYTGKAIVEKEIMFNAGSWWLLMNQCRGSFSKKWRQDLAKLSWEDYKNFNTGKSKYVEGYQVKQCDQKEAKKIEDWYVDILEYIIYEVNKITGSKIKNNSNKDKDTKNNQTESQNDESDDIKIKLKKLKNLFEEDLITEEEYNIKRNEILDEM